MTNQNNATQAAEQPTVLTREEVGELYKDWVCIFGVNAGSAELCIREIESALLSKLRAPVADERAAFDAVSGLEPPCASRRGNHFREGYLEARADALRVLGTLASAPVTEDDEVERIRGRGPAYPYTPNTAPPTPLASAPVAEEAKVQIEYLDMDNHRLRRALQKLMARLTDLLDEDQFANCESIVTAAGVEPPASTPVAGEAKNYPGDNVAERLDKMADGQPPGSQAQSDLYAAATIWRKHIAHRAAPQASAVAGEAVTWEAVRQELAIFLMGATGRSSKEWHRPLDNASEGGALARMRACLAAPQASAGQVQAALQKSFDMGKFYGSLPETDAEDVRNAALEEAAAICDSMDNHANPMTSRDCADAIRALKQPQAAKDARTCSCPSGDGSLRHPCAVHPPAPLVDESPNLQGSQVDGSTEMQGHAGAVVLPPLPKPVEQIGFLGGRPQDLFDLEGLRSYARAAVLADRQQRATQPEQGERDE